MGTSLPARDKSFGLAVEAQIRLELGKDTEHVEERLAVRARPVHGLFGGGEIGPTPAECRMTTERIFRNYMRKCRRRP